MGWVSGFVCFSLGFGLNIMCFLTPEDDLTPTLEEQPVEIIPPTYISFLK